MKRLCTYLKHFLLNIVFLAVVSAVVGYFMGADAVYGDNPLAYRLDSEGPHIFFHGDELSVNYIRGSRDDGFYVDQQNYAQGELFTTPVHFNLEDSSFTVQIDSTITSPAIVYEDAQPIIAISDVESSFRTFRDFLIQQQVIDENLEWRFGRGHLVLVGDFVDRGFSTTQVLWFIYRLEQSARAQGGMVHYILGNHEIKNLQGNFQKAAPKYLHIAALLGKQQYQLFDDDAFLGRWLASKNTVERINGYLFVHGGIHPQLAASGYSLEDLNQIVRAHYRQAYYPRVGRGDEDLLLSTTTGPSWYRGYFEAGLTQQELEQGLEKYQAKAVVVGHTPQLKVNQQYQAKLFAIDVKHPFDYRASFPPRSSEALLIAEDEYWRLHADGRRTKL